MQKSGEGSLRDLFVETASVGRRSQWVRSGRDKSRTFAVSLEKCLYDAKIGDRVPRLQTPNAPCVRAMGKAHCTASEGTPAAWLSHSVCSAARQLGSLRLFAST